ncbi:MAG: CBS domain-containing protein [Gemmatimonadales bacterium]|nr:CBS domain-containing protein [Gemmatimonadales bacterium]NIN11054.1 CBS domain-containing protein [Gemmatimonadales bacterium]NIN49651.1 CBS domain-containing protein [Gemmatimonadales bacterium]NIP07115.1 CBS domain-containing protein [Gemmatimonadales bacterium]NIQ99506.1 CBS domain-containing protein [Gemmatimonadales bacterium]
MKWSWKLGRVSGIKIQVHWTFLIIIAWVVLLHVSQGASAAAMVGGVALVLAVFGCVVLHELGHALTAKRFGISTRDITLLPIGGVARLEKMPEKPREELLVAVAGPAVNCAIATLLALGLGLARAHQPVAEVTVVGGNLFAQLMWINVILVLFNLLPAFPMDGGRILRALLAYRLDYLRSTRIAAAVGQMMAILFGFVGLLSNPFLVVIAIFVYLGAQAEAQQVQVRFALEGVSVREAMMTRFQVLTAHHTLNDAVGELLAGAQQDFPVLEDDRLVGMLIRGDLVKALKDRTRDTSVTEVMRREYQVVDENEDLHSALLRMRRGRCASVPAVRGQSVVGLLTLENVGELLMVSSALRGVSRDKMAEIFATD